MLDSSSSSPLQREKTFRIVPPIDYPLVASIIAVLHESSFGRP
jgi:hypothetical protein